jgi:hypothetical protein
MLRQSVKDTATRLRRWVSSLLLGEPDLGARLADLEARLGGKGLTGQITRIEQDVRALLRRQALPADTLPFPNRLTVQRFRGMSQNEEDGITLALMHEIGAPVRRFVEIGCGANGGNSGFFALECGWRGLMVDGDPERIAIARSLYEGCPVSVVQTWITREGIDDLIRMHGLDGEVDLLSIDIDGNDYWIWEAVTVCRPRAVIVEYNSLFGPELAVTIPYQEDFSRRTRSGKGYYGASLQALAYLAGRKGYRLVAIEPRGVNAYFLRNDVAPQVPACDPRQAFRGLDKLAYRNVREKAGGDVRTYFTSRGLPLVDVTSS